MIGCQYFLGNYWAGRCLRLFPEFCGFLCPPADLGSSLRSSEIIFVLYSLKNVHLVSLSNSTCRGGSHRRASMAAVRNVATASFSRVSFNLAMKLIKPSSIGGECSEYFSIMLISPDFSTKKMPG